MGNGMGEGTASSERCWSLFEEDTAAAQSQQNFKGSSLKLCLETVALPPLHPHPHHPSFLLPLSVSLALFSSLPPLSHSKQQVE